MVLGVGVSAGAMKLPTYPRSSVYQRFYLVRYRKGLQYIAWHHVYMGIGMGLGRGDRKI